MDGESDDNYTTWMESRMWPRKELHYSMFDMVKPVLKGLPMKKKSLLASTQHPDILPSTQIFYPAPRYSTQHADILPSTQIFLGSLLLCSGPCSNFRDPENTARPAASISSGESFYIILLYTSTSGDSTDTDAYFSTEACMVVANS